MALDLSELSCHPPPLPEGALLSLSVTVSSARALLAEERRAGEATALGTLVTRFAALARKQSINNLPPTHPFTQGPLAVAYRQS